MKRTNKLYFLTGLGGGNTDNSTEIPASTEIPTEENDNVEDDESVSNQEEEDDFLNERKTNKILKTKPV